MNKTEFAVTFWGVRGSRPVPGSSTLKYGGNTACVQVSVGSKLIIFDAGTGICSLGYELDKQPDPIEGHIFIGHTHWDHIQGFPFFTPAFRGKNRFNIYGQKRPGYLFADLMASQMQPPYFPVSIDKMTANLNFMELTGDDTVYLGDDITVKTIKINHPNGCLAYRVETNGLSCCYLSDMEHSARTDRNLIKFIKKCDLLIYDANFTDDEYHGADGHSPKTGWGHSTWQEGIRLAKASGARALVLYHHSPFRTDSDLDTLEALAQQEFPNCFAARERMTITLRPFKLNEEPIGNRIIPSYPPNILQDVEKLLNIGIALSAEKNHDELLEMILTHARYITNADAGTLYLRDNDQLLFKIVQNETMDVFISSQEAVSSFAPVPLDPRHVSAYVALTRKLVNIPDVYKTSDFDFSGPKQYDSVTGYHTQSMLVIPLENHDGDVIGVLQLINAKDNMGQIIPFEPYLERSVASLASQAAVTLSNMQLITDRENLFNSFVEVMATAIDEQTPYNVNHSRRLAVMAAAMARVINNDTSGSLAHLYFDEEQISCLSMAAWLHDIGKIATPIEVINKSSRLDRAFDQVMHRLDHIKSLQRISYLEQKLKLVGSKKTKVIEKLEDWWQEQVDKLQKARDLIRYADDAATYVSPEIRQQLEALADLTYEDGDGLVLPWITRDELEALCIPRGTLTEAERQVIEEHVDVSRRMLEKIPFIKKFENVPRYAAMHHEYLDGSGYPLGLSHDQIPLEARILALLDIYDALTASDRPYKKATPLDESLVIMGTMVKEGKLDEALFWYFVTHRIWEYT